MAFMAGEWWTFGGMKYRCGWMGIAVADGCGAGMVAGFGRGAVMNVSHRLGPDDRALFLLLPSPGSSAVASGPRHRDRPVTCPRIAHIPGSPRPDQESNRLRRPQATRQARCGATRSHHPSRWRAPRPARSRSTPRSKSQSHPSKCSPRRGRPATLVSHRGPGWRAGPGGGAASGSFHERRRRRPPSLEEVLPC